MHNIPTQQELAERNAQRLAEAIAKLGERYAHHPVNFVKRTTPCDTLKTASQR